jgi:hypothetical protein
LFYATAGKVVPMSQREALIASIAITLVLALSAIGIRAVMLDSPADAASGDKQPAAITVVSGSSAGESAFRQAADDDQQGDDDESDHGISDNNGQYSNEHEDDEGEHDD